MKQAYLLTGGPGVGKTTLIKCAVDRTPMKAGGFFTEEIRVGGTRHGFRIVTLDGQSGILAHVAVKSPHRVGKYGVDTDCLDSVGVKALNDAIDHCDLVVIDEIGKMELCSPAFREAVHRVLSSNKRLLGTIMLAPNPWADSIKNHPCVRLNTVTRANREQALEQVLHWLNAPIA